MKLITFGLGGAKGPFLRLGFGSTAKVAEARVDGGVLRGQFRPVIVRPPILLDVVEHSRVAVRVRFTNRTEIAHRVSRVRALPHEPIGAGGYVRGGRGERAYHELQRTAKDLNCIAAWVEDFCKRCAGDLTMTKTDRDMLHDTVSYLRATMARYRRLRDALAEPRHLALEAGAYAVLQRHARAQQDARDIRDVLDMVAVLDYAEGIDSRASS